jgi:putative membrane protein
MLDLAVWGATALIIQLVAFRVVDLLLKDLSARIVRGEMAPSITLAAAKLGTAFMTAAALMG